MSVKRKFRRSYLWAAVFAAAIVVWIGSGTVPELLGGSEPAEEPAPVVVADRPFRVEVTRVSAQPKPALYTARGRTEASRRVEVRARTTGIVEALPHQEGEVVDTGDLLCRLDRGVRDAELAEERAKLESAKIDYEATSRLADQQFAPETRRASERAALDAAEAALERMEREIAYTSIVSPIAGTIERRAAELGSFLQIGGLCATLIDLDPILVVVNVSERDIASIEKGMSAGARLVTGETVRGTVAFISPAADPETRTFRVEVEIENADLSLRDGITAEMLLELPMRDAHLLPSSILTLNDDGVIGVRIVTPENIVRFVPLTILSEGRGGIWVSGLDDTVDVITVGQDYVLDGQTVIVVQRTAETTR